METNDADPPLNLAVYKKREFDCYCLWRSMPPVFRGQPRHVLEKFGIDDELTMTLLSIKNQTEFAGHFGIKDLGTLTDWNKRIEANGGLMRNIHDWARKLTPNVMAALYKAATTTGKAAEVKAWMEIVEGM